MKLIINGHEVTGNAGQTILDVANNNGVEIPTLCHDERVEIFGSCGICTVEIAGNPRLFRACSTRAADGMVVSTDTERIRRNRKTVLELLLSAHTGDCRPPCALACPAETECQGYVKLIAEGDYDGALKLIMEKIPLPASIGRVCPHPCEDACRRELVEEPVAIAALKAFAADRYDAGSDVPHEAAPPTDKHIAVVGGGPGGLSAAYFLRLKGHAVTVYDAMPEMGGMLRYGIPEYRLPKALLQKEIDIIAKTGAELCNNVSVGRDITLDELRGKYDAVIVAAGAWISTGLRCPGEEMDGVIGGIGFLSDVSAGNIKAADEPCKNEIKPRTIAGLKVAVVGGGNTAMDACRTAVRLGADKVYNIYRRTKSEMPAEEIEITEAEEEGVIFKNLTNPIEIIGDNGSVKAVRLQIMELGEPDASGRRAPVPVEGAEEVLDVDIVISAIGQKLNPSGFEALEMTRWGTIISNPQTFCTNLQGVFAIGDAINDGAGIAITAIGHAVKAAAAVDNYLRGDLQAEIPGSYIEKTEKTAEDFAGEPKKPRVKMPHRPPSERRNDFNEINLGFTEEMARNEAARCLECGCLDYAGCKIIKYANQYHVKPERFCAGSVPVVRAGGSVPNVIHTPDKCILCGLCVRICEEEVGAGVLGFVGRGFNTQVMPAGDLSPCENCKKCAEICPTGAMHS